MKDEPTFLGHVAAVTGATVSVRRAESLASGIAIIGGQTYRVAQVGSFVRIPQGYVDLYGVVSEVGVSAAPELLPEATLHAESWVTVQLVGESVAASFERGITQRLSASKCAYARRLASVTGGARTRTR